MKFFGIDGCKKGWFYVGINEGDQYEFGIITAFEEILAITNQAKQILIDIPIGLREEESLERLCDLEARKVLGNRRSSVFPSPSRLALGYEKYSVASTINFNHTGKKLNKQSFAISKKIKEVDEFIIFTELQGKFREMHPEICFWALNKKQSMKFNKKGANGINERIQILKKYFSKTNNLVREVQLRYLRKDLANDDILDALVGAISARFYPNLKQLSTSPEVDTRELKMEIVYPIVK